MPWQAVGVHLTVRFRNLPCPVLGYAGPGDAGASCARLALGDGHHADGQLGRGCLGAGAPHCGAGPSGPLPNGHAAYIARSVTLPFVALSC